MAISKKTPKGPQKKRSGGAARASKKAKPTNTKTTSAAACAATTVKGTACKLKPSGGSKFCARHADQQPAAGSAPATASMKNGQKTRARKTPADPGPAAKKRASKAKPLKVRAQRTISSEDSAAGSPQRTLDQASESPDLAKAKQQAPPADQDEGAAESGNPESTPDDDTFYGSEFSTTMEASPYDDLITTEMAQGEEDVELRDEQEFGRDQQRGRPSHPRPSREEAQEMVRKRLGPRPEIAPEEDLNEELAKYDRRFEAELRRVMGFGNRKRGRRGGRRRKGGGGGGGSSGGGAGGGGGPQGGQRGGGGRPRRGRRGGRGGPRTGGGGRGGTGGPGTRSGGPPSSAARKVGRDSPLAQKRASKGPKRGVQPRRRREPDV